MGITKATIKSFIRKNAEKWFIKVESDFNGMSDCVEHVEDRFKQVDANKIDFDNKNTFGIAGAWFVGNSRDYFNEYDFEDLYGYYIYNSCGSFVLATK